MSSVNKDEKTLHDRFVVFQNLLFVGIVVILASLLFQNTVLFWIIWGLGLLIAVAAIVYRNKYFKCPHCGSKLDVRGVPKYCPDCRKELV